MRCFMTARLVLSTAVLLAGCTQLRYGLAPAKDDSLAAAFASGQAAEEFFASFLDVSVDVIVGVSYENFAEQVEQARAAGRPVSPGDVRIASGTVVDEGRLITTAAHVVRGVGPIVLSGRGTQKSFHTQAVIVWCSGEVDLAALRPAKPFARGLEWAEELQVGEDVYLVGLWDEHATGTILEIAHPDAAVQTIAHSAPIRGGDSGGPLLTSTGQLAAINTRIEFDAFRYAFSEGRRIVRMPRTDDCR